MDKGSLVPDKVTIEMLISEIEKHPEAAGFIFDGFPRTEAQAQALDEILKQRGTAIDRTLALDVEEEELKQRLIKRAMDSGRKDDADPKIVQNRILVYLSETFPVKSFYKKQGKLVIISGHGTIDEITSRLVSEIRAISK
jgi:adenylate kinase